MTLQSSPEILSNHQTHQLERITVAAELNGTTYEMVFERTNAYPARVGQAGLTLVDVQPPFPGRIDSRSALYSVDSDIESDSQFALRLGSTDKIETFRALDVNKIV